MSNYDGIRKKEKYLKNAIYIRYEKFMLIYIFNEYKPVH